MKGRLRIRRLTMAKQSLSSGPLGGYPDDPELERFLDLERLHRMNECLVASTSKTGPVVHGVENFHGGVSRILQTTPIQTQMWNKPMFYQRHDNCMAPC